MRGETTQLEREVMYQIYSNVPSNHYELRGFLRGVGGKKSNIYEEGIMDISTLDKVLRGLENHGYIAIGENGFRVTQEGIELLMRLEAERFV